ncbi:MAG: bifunctional phosphoribosyl-AMP cyclohydrolase/phosphoribosyl-ATP diphosphatase HisIE [Synergistales bacterium]|nr:bifunctional phosphoribosyl-AMP cyclohydrolase/phosphoribosyl-ATP diphosphatase HisIE [Synergistales bacterium]
MRPDLLRSITFDEKGLIPVIVQHYFTGQVLMLAFSNAEAVELTIRTGEIHFFSRSRQKLWHKGRTSGNIMELVELRIDCDQDCLLALVRPLGPACHTGEKTCFYRSITGDSTADISFLDELYQILLSRKELLPENSYTANLFQQGIKRISQKIGEEGVETSLAMTSGDRNEVIAESADLIYHLMVGLVERGIALEELVQELLSRHTNP